MPTSHVQIALQDQVLRVTLCRPEKKNALTNDGRTAAAWGIANECAPATELRDRAASVAQKLAARPPVALRAMKRLLRQTNAIAIAMARESEVFGARLQSSEAAEVFRAFAERRTPDFSSFT